MLTKRRAIVWFRQDLRLHDNAALTEALDSALEVVPVYVFDDRFFRADTQAGIRRVGPHRLQFIIESVQDLRRSLRRLGGKLIVRVGRTEEELFDIAKAAKTSWVFCNRERTPIEENIQDQLEKKLWSIGQEIRFSRGKMLYHTADLPFPVQHVPDSFAQYRKETERYVSVREPLPSPHKPFAQLTFDVEEGRIPTLADFGFEPTIIGRGNHFFRGGERAGLQRLEDYVWDSTYFEQYPKTNQEIQGENISSMLSPWLAQGCLSPKLIYRELKRYEKTNGNSKAVESLIYALRLRDYHRFMVKKHGDVIFRETGIPGVPLPVGTTDQHLYMQWVNGKTGCPFIDAAMVQLRTTGYLPNRMRQNVASYLINELGVSWRLGASFFEHILIDYDVTSNWSNWTIMAGVGAEIREDRKLNAEAQAQRYDPRGTYVEKWLFGEESVKGGASLKKDNRAGKENALPHQPSDHQASY